MIPVHPTEREGARLVLFGVNQQDDYFPLIASVDDDGVVMTEWLPSAEELQLLASGCRVRMWVHTGGDPLQPVSLQVAGSSNPVKES